MENKKFISWNVNGIRACVNKDFMSAFKSLDADIFCLQETKLQEGQIELDLPGYHQYWNYAEKKGYSGTAIFSKEEPIAVTLGIGSADHDAEGRAITLEFPKFYFITLYVPNAQDGLKRIDFRMDWEDKLRAFASNLAKNKPVVICGDLNVAHNEIDLKNPKANVGNAGFSNEERGKFGELLDAGFIDSFRYLYPEKVEYSWWSYRFNARANNSGWRIDYFLVSENGKENIVDSKIHGEIFGSDHCPVELNFKI